MFIPLVDILRCPRPHEETWLVASIERAEDRDMLEGVLGCPICLAEYPVHDGVVGFGSGEPAPRGTAGDADALRIAAALDLTDARMTAVLHGAWGANAQLVRGLSPAQLLLLNAPPGMASGDGVSIVVAGTAPFAQGSVDAVALDAGADAAMIESLVRSLRAKGRMMAPASVPVPAGLEEIVRDDAGWVARLDTKVVISAPVPLTRRERPGAGD